ncbi:MAG: hypothetical protein MSS52_09065 [Prevotella sp.]|nr:hypothetical protein [Prevotella sp.]MCI7652269.1 hypothetical protein [Prevotella sp.]
MAATSQINRQASTRNQATHGSSITDQLANFNQKQGNSVTDQLANLNQKQGDTWQQRHGSIGKVEATHSKQQHRSVGQPQPETRLHQTIASQINRQASTIYKHIFKDVRNINETNGTL